MRKLLVFCIFVLLLIPAVLSFVDKGMFVNGILAHLPVASGFVKKDYNTYTSITGIKDEMQLVTAKQNLDFITVLDGVDGCYIEIATYEVKAGIDCSKIIRDVDDSLVKLPVPEVLSSDKKHSLVLRTPPSQDGKNLYEMYLKPVDSAYTQKARDYAVELGILQRAEEGIEDVFSGMTGITNAFHIERKSYTEQIDVPYLPFRLSVADGYLERANLEVVPQSVTQFNRDAVVLQFSNSVASGQKIRFGYTGMRYTKTYEEFFTNVFTTNAQPSNAGRDAVEVFRYFDPLYPRQTEVLSYASDYFRTFFILLGGRIYYLDAVCTNEQDLMNTVSPILVYLATSLRPLQNEAVDGYAAYTSYIERYYSAAQSLRNRKDKYVLTSDVTALIAHNTAADNDGMTADEKMFLAVSELKNGTVPDAATGDKTFDLYSSVYEDVKLRPLDFTDDAVREKVIQEVSDMNHSIETEQGVNLNLPSYLKNWFVQNKAAFRLPDEKTAEYKNGIVHIVSRDAIIPMTDAERNEYYYELFKDRIANSRLYKDTSEKDSDVLVKSKRGNYMLAYCNIPSDKRNDGEVFERIEEMNGRPLAGGAFVLVYNQKEWSWGAFEDSDIHAIVLDDATIRFFPKVVADTEEKAKKALYALFPFLYRESETPEYFYFGDWKKLKISADGISFAGKNFSTRRLTKKGREEYRNSNEYAELSVIGKTLQDFQNAFSLDNPSYYYDALTDAIFNEIQNYAYRQAFRPSPRMIIDTSVDEMRRYNY